VIDEPSANGYYGGVVCAPLFKNVVEYALKRDKTLLPAQCYNLEPRNEKKQPGNIAVAASSGPDAGREAAKVNLGGYPSVTGLTLKEAAEVLARFQIRWRAVGSGVVLEQHPDAQSALDAGKVCSLILGETE
jgi:outer membrane PBP1 activator LpoA protein